MSHHSYLFRPMNILVFYGIIISLVLNTSTQTETFTMFHLYFTQTKKKKKQEFMANAHISVLFFLLFLWLQVYVLLYRNIQLKSSQTFVLLHAHLFVLIRMQRSIPASQHFTHTCHTNTIIYHVKSFYRNKKYFYFHIKSSKNEHKNL